MIDVEERLRAGLEDGGWDRPVPPNAMQWVAAEASKQRLRRLPIVAVAASVAVGVVFVGATQLDDAGGATTYGAEGPDPTPSSCPGFVHPSDGVPVWPNELKAVIRAAADFDTWRVTDSRPVVDCRGSGFRVGALVQLDPTGSEQAGPLEVERVLADQITVADLRDLAAADLDGATVHAIPAVAGADTTFLVTSGDSLRVLASSSQSGTVVTITQTSVTAQDVTLASRRLGDLAGQLLTLRYRTRY